MVLGRLCKGDGKSKTCSFRLSWQKIVKVVEVHQEAANEVFLVYILKFVCLIYDKKRRISEQQAEERERESEREKEREETSGADAFTPLPLPP